MESFIHDIMVWYRGGNFCLEQTGHVSDLVVFLLITSNTQIKHWIYHLANWPPECLTDCLTAGFSNDLLFPSAESSPEVT
jgi:hypothetical protein